MTNIINIPISLIKGYKDNKTDLEALACAILIKHYYQNSCVYRLSITKMINLFGLSYKKACKVFNVLKTHELFIYNEKKNCVFAKSFKSKDEKRYGKHGQYAATSDYCRKLEVKDGMKMREVVKQLRYTLLLNAINASEHDGLIVGIDKNNTIATKQNAKRVIPQRKMAKAISMSKQSVSRFIKELVEIKEVGKSEIVAECVIPVLNDKTASDYYKNHLTPFIPYHDKENGGWSGWVMRGRAYSILKRDISESFKHVIYNYKRRTKAVLHTSSELDGEGYWAKIM